MANKIENTFECIDALMDKMTEKGFNELEYSCDDFEIRLVKNAPVVAAAAAPAPVVAPAAAAPVSAPAAAKPGNIVKSPIVGTFYAAPAPDKAPFVTIGKQVKKGDVIMIIESMKLMNEVQSEFDGTVEEIMVENGEAVEFDQPIMRIV